MSLEAEERFWQRWLDLCEEARVWFETCEQEERKYQEWLEDHIRDGLEEDLREMMGIDLSEEAENAARLEWLYEGRELEAEYSELLDDTAGEEEYHQWLDRKEEAYYEERQKLSRKRMHSGNCLYHVSNQVCDDPNPAKRPKWSALRGHPANNPYYDGPLFGTSGVFFSTNLTSYGYGLPTRSPYPTSGVAGRRYWRAKIPLARFAGYSLSLVTETERQVLLLATKSGEQTFAFQNRHGNNIMPLCKADNEYLRCTDEGRWYVRVYDNNYDPCFVNVLVPGNFSLEDVEWDSVERF